MNGIDQLALKEEQSTAEQSSIVESPLRHIRHMDVESKRVL